MFVDLEKAYDKVPREEVWYCMRKSGLYESPEGSYEIRDTKFAMRNSEYEIRDTKFEIRQASTK